MGTVDERIEQLRALMKERNLCVYVVPTSDAHASEYVGAHYKSRAFLTGFTGSAGTAVVTMDEVALFTDGRYFVQAEKQIADSQVKLFKMGEPDVPKVTEYVASCLCKQGGIGFDGGCMASKDAEKYQKIAEEKNGFVSMTEDLVSLIWTDRPALPQEPVWVLGQQYAGEDTSEKIERIREKISEEKADCHLIGSLYDIAWITNLRGNDISHVPVFLSFLYITADEVRLYAFGESWSEDVLSYLNKQKITLCAYERIYDELPELLKGRMQILLDKETINARLVEQIPDDIQIKDKKDPSVLMRAVKNDIEIANTIEAHIRDGVAVTKFIYYLKQNIGKEPITELSAADYLQKMREEQPGFLDLSFDTICAYKANAAMMHYSATPEDFAELEPEGMLLVDSGGHYFGGTTDITRTIVLGAISDEIKMLYTKVLQGHLRLSHAKFPKGVAGQNLDVLAREPLWAMGLDYRCGTGHGVGHILNVHEGPNTFRWRISDVSAVQSLEAGMITTNEPGFYQDGAFGIRIENELLCVEGEKTEYGQYFAFSDLTYAPIDLEAVNPELLSAEERQWLNDYHQQVYDKISPYLNEEEKEWLQYETRAI